MSTQLILFFILLTLIIIANSKEKNNSSLKKEVDIFIQNQTSIRQLQELNISETNKTIYLMHFYRINLIENELKLYCKTIPNTPDDLNLWIRLIIIKTQNKEENGSDYRKEEIGVLAKKTEENEKYEIFSSPVDILNFNGIIAIKIKNIMQESYNNNSIYNITFSNDLYIHFDVDPNFNEYNTTPTDSYNSEKATDNINNAEPVTENGTEKVTEYLDVDLLDNDDKTKSSETKGILSVGIILCTINGILFIIIIINVIICLCRNRKMKHENKMASNISILETQNNDPINSLKASKTNLNIETYINEPEKQKLNPITFLFLTTSQYKLNITIESDKKMEDLIKFYFQILNKPNLYNDREIVFVKNARTIYHNCQDLVGQYFDKKNENIILVVDQDNKIS